MLQRAREKKTKTQQPYRGLESQIAHLRAEPLPPYCSNIQPLHSIHNLAHIYTHTFIPPQAHRYISLLWVLVTTKLQSISGLSSHLPIFDKNTFFFLKEVLSSTSIWCIFDKAHSSALFFNLVDSFPWRSQEGQRTEPSHSPLLQSPLESTVLFFHVFFSSSLLLHLCLTRNHVYHYSTPDSCKMCDPTLTQFMRRKLENRENDVFTFSISPPTPSQVLLWPQLKQ